MDAVVGGHWDRGTGQSEFARAALPHLDACYSLAMWLLRDPTLAEEVVQDAFERALRYFPSFRGDGEARAWLLQIVRTTAFDALARRRRGAEVPLPEGEYATPLVEPGPDPESVLRDRQAIRHLDEALAGLPVEWRECLVLRELEGLSYREIARVAGVPVGTVMSRLFRARKALLAWRAARAEAERER